jgi:hypothetical protein
METDAEKLESVIEILYRLVTANGAPPRAGQRMLRGWLRQKVQGRPHLLAAAGIPEQAAMKIRHEVYLVWRWKGAKQPTYENMPEDGWSVEKHIDMLCKALEAYGRNRERSELGGL